ncbi:MAG: AraC family transcriptional regulator [Planctomycetota bacterium]|nr:AraC family transcriptional regulator [Planctomycetota bacterium]
MNPAAPAPQLRILEAQQVSLWQQWGAGKHGKIAPYWRLYWNAEPGVEVGYGRQCHHLGPDQVVVIPPYLDWHGTIAREVPHTYVHCVLGRPYDRARPGLLVVPLDAAQRREIAALSERMRCWPAVDAVSWMALQAWTLACCARLPAQIWGVEAADARIRSVLDAIDADPGVAVDNEAWARRCGLSTNAFVRLFSQEVGESPQRYQRRQRLALAALLLEHEDLSIERIAERCGFCDRHHLGRAFKRHYQLAPAAYRRRSGAG